MRLDTALYRLRTDPLTFLRTNLLAIAGGPQSMATRFYIGYHDMFIGGGTTNEGFKLSNDPMMARSSVVGTDGRASTSLNVHNVRMIPGSEPVDLSDIEPYTLGNGGPDLMITGQLSGCVFVVRQNGAGLTVAHIQPGGTRQSGPMLRQTIRLMGRFGALGRVTHVFGVGTEYLTRAHVVGIRTGGAWHLYAQQCASGLGPVTGSVQIV